MLIRPSPAPALEAEIVRVLLAASFAVIVNMVVSRDCKVVEPVENALNEATSVVLPKATGPLTLLYVSPPVFVRVTAPAPSIVKSPLARVKAMSVVPAVVIVFPLLS